MQSLTKQFADWVATKPRDEEYNFLAPSHCAFAEFEKDLGCFHGPRTYEDYGNGNPVLPTDVREALVSPPWTFGALADRLSA